MAKSIDAKVARLIRSRAMIETLDAKVARLMVLVGHCIQAPAHQEGRDKLQSTIRTQLGEVFVAGMSCGPASVQPAAQSEPASIGGELTDADLQLLGEIADQLETDDHFFKSGELRRLKKRIAANQAVQPDYTVHSCSYFCENPACIKTQRDELRDKAVQPAEPLTTYEIEDLWDAQLFHITDLAMAIDFVRDVEAAHNIKPKEAQP